MQESQSWSDLDGFKVRFAQRAHSPVHKPIEDHLHGGTVLWEPQLTHSASIVLGEGAKRFYDPRYCYPDMTRKGKKYLPAPEPPEGRNSGKKLISVLEYSSSEISLPTKKKNKDAAMKRSESTDLPSIGWTKKKPVLTEDGISAALKESEIYNLEASMNRKQRVQNILNQRNLIPSATPGDNAYQQADREPGFFTKGGLIPGSTNILHKSGKPSLRKSEDLNNTNGSGKKLEFTYAKMKSELEKQYDVNQVLALTVSLLTTTYCTYSLL
jgi:hypothetical protein